jgi:TonB family protein
MTDSIAQRTLASPRITALAGIVTLHMLIAYLLLTALVQRPVPEAAPPPIVVVPIAEDPKPPEPKPMIQNGATDRTTRTRIHETEWQLAPLVTPEAPTPDGTALSLETPSPPPLPPIRVLGKHWLPSSEAYYPADLIRLGVQGDSLVRVCVDESGRLSGAPSLERSSGNARLDQGALNVTRAGRYARAVRGDTPVANCYLFRVVFTMK